ncbi:hypothetical protein TRIUR3_13862 [Triticum urartu]|uniref:Uncharacterized protein n=1 Tax=Triticum urartu TaxID=4572 RepID=M7ZUA8_TRIUA|nr:hypothetical protein TRIUR3_13862 [Triticum urartu]
MAFVPGCVQCGTRSNPCRCKVVGPTLGFVAFVVTGVVEWPLGAAPGVIPHPLAADATAPPRRHLFHSPATSPVSHLRRLISAAVSSNPSGFAVEEYLVATCGLTRPQAVKASAKLSHLKTPANPDAVLAFLAILDGC